MIVNRIQNWARVQPEKTAIISDGIALSYAWFSRSIEATRLFLGGFGLPPGRTAVILAPSLVDSWLIDLALRSLGLDTISVVSIDQMEKLRIANVACLVVADTEPITPGLGRRMPPDAKLIAMSASIYTGIHTGDLPSARDDAPPFGGHILYTSGTTGTYKKLLFDGGNEDRRNVERARYFSVDRKTVYHGLGFELFSAAGFNHPSAVWHAGGTVVFDQGPDKFEKFFSYGADWAFLVPPMLRKLLGRRDAQESPAGDVELVVAGGFLPLDVAEETLRRLTPRLTIVYGSSESCTPVMRSRFRSRDDLYWLTPSGDRTVQIVDEAGNECPAEQEGELRVLATEVEPTAYMDDAAASAKVFRDGFFYPGDIAVRRADGRIRVLGRTADVLNMQGRKLAVAPLEQAVQQTLSVEEVCLFAGLDDDGKEELVIAIQSDRKPTPAEIDLVVKRFPGFERIRFSFWSAFPRAETGMTKTDRKLLRRMVFSRTD